MNVSMMCESWVSDNIRSPGLHLRHRYLVSKCNFGKLYKICVHELGLYLLRCLKENISIEPYTRRIRNDFDSDFVNMGRIGPFRHKSPL